MKFTGSVVLSYGILVLIGGLIGYLTKGSLGSLFAGSFCGALLIASALGLFKSSLLAYFTALATSGLLTVFFAFRYFQTGNMMPAGDMGLLSLAVFLFLLTTKSPRSLKQTKE